MPSPLESQTSAHQYLLTKSRGAASVNRCRLNPTCFPKTPKPTIPLAKQNVSPQYRHKRVSTQSPASYKSCGLDDGFPSSIEKPLTPPKHRTLSAPSVRNRSEDEQLEVELDNGPMTPLGPGGSADVVTAPKQRELWGKLV